MRPRAAILPRGSVRDVASFGREPVDAETLAAAASIVEDVRARGEAALRAQAERFGDLAPGSPLVIGRASLDAALGQIPDEERAALTRAHSRIRSFAIRQRDSIREFSVGVPGGECGQLLAPVERAGCYAPGGRHPLPSSVLMTATVARAAGVKSVWVASPRPAPATLAAAAIAGADALLCAGGAQAIAALAFGAGPVPACDAVVGPGNRFVTAAKKLIAGRVAIDGLAGPSEIVAVADATASPRRVAQDLVAQAEHDPDARVVLIATDAAVADRIVAEAERALDGLPTAETARAALARGKTILASTLDEAIAASDEIAPEHLLLAVEEPEAALVRARHFGAAFLSDATSVVFGDYGAGPNHVLPTAGTARAAGGLSVFTFLRVRTWLRVDESSALESLARDAALIARVEGLEAHARAAESRAGRPASDREP